MKFKVLYHNGREFVVEAEASTLDEGMALLEKSAWDRPHLVVDDGNLNIKELNQESIIKYSIQLMRPPKDGPSLKEIK